MSDTYHLEFKGTVARILSRVGLHVRRKMYLSFEAEFGSPSSVLDVGVTSSADAVEANYFEEYFPFKNRITALGIEDANHLESRYPGLKFIKVDESFPWPFQDRQFEVVFSNAVLEHITSKQQQINFIKEILRVGKNAFITVPYRWFPVEHHTGLPLAHWLPAPLFFKILKLLGRDKFYSPKNLSFIGKRHLREVVEKSGRNVEIRSVSFLGFTSNLILVVKEHA